MCRVTRAVDTKTFFIIFVCLRKISYNASGRLDTKRENKEHIFNFNFIYSYFFIICEYYFYLYLKYFYCFRK